MTGSELTVPESPAPAGASRRGTWLRAGAAVVSLVAAAGFVYAVAGTLGTTAEEVPLGTSAGSEPLANETLVVTQTSLKNVIQVRIRNVDPDRVAFTAIVAGIPEGGTGAWFAVLDDGTEIPMAIEVVGDHHFAVSLEEPVPAGRTVEQVRLDPDAAEEDLLFDVS